MHKAKVFKTTKVKLSEFPTEVHEKLETMYIGLEAAKADAVAAERQARLAINKAAQQRAAADSRQLELIVEAANFIKSIECETQWTVYRGSDGKLVFEGVTERVMRNAARAGLNEMNKKVESNELDMYEEDDEDENHGHEGH